MTIAKNVKIKTKLIVGFSVLFFIVFCVCYIGYNGIIKVSKATNVILENQVPITNYSMELVTSFTTTRKVLADYLANRRDLNKIEDRYDEKVKLFHEVYALKDELALSEKHRKQVEAFGAKISEYEEIAKEIMVIHVKSIIDAKKPALLMKKMDKMAASLVKKAQRANFSLEDYGKISQLIMAANDYISSEASSDAAAFKKYDLEIRKQNKFSEIKTDYTMVYFFGKKVIKSVSTNIEYKTKLHEKIKVVDKIGSEVDKILTSLNETANVNMTKAKEIANSTLTNTRNLMAGVVALGLLFAFFVLFFVVKSITSPIIDLVKVVKKIAKGDLTEVITMKSGDEIGELASAMDTMENDLSFIVGNIISSSETVAAGANEIAVGNQNLSQHSQEQASSIEETAATVEEMSAIIKSNAESSQEIENIAKNTTILAKKGDDKLLETVESMTSLTESSKKISEITSMVDEIAFQTNLLALNAAVEAARAGEQGRGFAVVANEVRNLASRCSGAAKDIQKLISHSIAGVETSNKLVNESGIIFKEITTEVNKQTEAFTKIANTTREQARAIEQVNTSVNEMDKVIRATADLVERAEVTSDKLFQEAKGMRQLMGAFKIDLSSDNKKIVEGKQPRKEAFVGSLEKNIANPAYT